MNLSLENRVLLSLIAKTSFGKDIPFLQGDEKLADIDWVEVYKESAKQTVVLFASGAISSYANVIPKEVFGKWITHSSKSISSNMAVMNCQNELAKFLDKNSYKYIILKGLASSSYYENPDMRMLGDVDFLIENDKKDEIAQRIQNELKYNKHDDDELVCHITMTRNRDAIEMHFEIPGVPHGENGEIVRNAIKDILNDTIKSTVDISTFSAPSHFFHGVIIILHMLRHMTSEGLGLRHLCDWGAFVNKTANMDFWDKDFIPFLQKIGLVKYASVMASVCQKYMGIDMPSCLPVANDNLCEDMINDILHSGNFGNKDEQYHQSGMLLSQNGKDGVKKSAFLVLFERLNTGVKSQLPWLKKWKILLPFAYIIFAIRYCVRVVLGKRPSLTSLMPEANRRKELYKKLEIYEDNE